MSDHASTKSFEFDPLGEAKHDELTTRVDSLLAAPVHAPPVGGPAFAPPAPVAPFAIPATQHVPVDAPYGHDGTNPADVVTVPAVGVVGADRPDLERLLCGLVWCGGSDLHLAAGEIPRYRVAGQLLPVAAGRPMSGSEIEAMMSQAVSPYAWGEFQREKDMDTSYAMNESEGAAFTSRFRINVFRSMGSTGAVIRVIPTEIATLDDLGVPNQIKSLASKPRGIVLVTGATGSGKSTTLAALVDLINETRSERIFTLEDPIEFTHSSKKCLVSHREVGEDTASFVEGLRRVRREDPDIILIGEMRDYQTVAAAIEAADTGHLVLATLHTNSAPETISRIVNQFPANQQEQVRITLSSTLIAILCQTLVPSGSSARGRVLACEILMVNAGVRNNIRENDIPAIASALVDQSNGNMSLDAHLAMLIQQGAITKKDAMLKASSPGNLDQLLGIGRMGARS